MNAIALFTEEQLARAHRRQSSECPELWTLLDEVFDPEIPVISIWDLGVLQNVSISDNEISVVITPTYSSCPAMDVIEEGITECLSSAGYSSVTVERQLSPVWSTDWLSPRAKKQLLKYGIAPPVEKGSDALPACPQCGTNDVVVISDFGSTACKALYKCSSCLEPFDYFKCL